LPSATDVHRIQGHGEAARLGRVLAEYELRCYAEPVTPEGRHRYREMRRTLPMPVAGGENAHMLFGFAELLGVDCVDLAQPDLGTCAGSSVGRHIASLPLAHHSLFATEPVLAHDRSSRPFCQQPVARPLQMVDGWVEVPDAPGHGRGRGSRRVGPTSCFSGPAP